MCGILLSRGQLNKEKADLVKRRGLSHCKEESRFGYNLFSSVLSIRSNVSQPVNDILFSFLYNGEIYNSSASDSLFIKEIIKKEIEKISFILDPSLNLPTTSSHIKNLNKSDTVDNFSINLERIKNDKDNSTITPAFVNQIGSLFEPDNYQNLKSYFNFAHSVYSEINRFECEIALVIVTSKFICFFKDDIGKRSLGFDLDPFCISSVLYNNEIDPMKIYVYDVENESLFSSIKKGKVTGLYLERMDLINTVLRSEKYRDEYSYLTGYDDCISMNYLEYSMISDSNTIECNSNIDNSLDKVNSIQSDNLDTYEIQAIGSSFTEKLHSLMVSSFTKRICLDDPIVFLSGGIDSLIIAIYVHLVSDISKTIYLINSAVPGSFDREMGMLAYQDLISQFPSRKFIFITVDINLEKILNEEASVRRLIYPKIGKMDFNIANILYFTAQEATKHGNIVYLGSGADELFGGYNKYRKEKDGIVEEANFRTHMLFDLFTISVHNICRDDRVISNFNLEARFPLLDSDILEFSLQLPEDCFISNNENKAILRDLLRYNGFERAASVPKKAMQYGSGISKFEKSLYTDDTKTDESINKLK